MNRFFCQWQIKNNTHRFVYKDKAPSPEEAAILRDTKEMLRAPKGPDSQYCDERRDAEDVAAFNKGSLIDRIEAQNAIDESGEPKLYLETFEKSPKLDQVFSTLRSGMEAGGVYSHYNFNEWVSQPRMAARVFETFDDTNFMPSGKGRLNFVRGLYAQPTSKEYNESIAVLTQIKDILNKRFTLENQTRDALSHGANTPLVGHTMNGYLSNLTNAWNNGTGGEKGLMAVAGIGIGLFLWKNKDADILGTGINTKDVLMWGGFGAALNYLSGAVSYDGKTFLNRLGTGTDAGVDDLQNQFIKGYAIDRGMDKDKTKLKALQVGMNFDVKHLYHLYHAASGPLSTKREIPMSGLGLADGQINGAGLYDIIDDLVKQTAINAIKNQMLLEQGKTKYSELNDSEVQVRISEISAGGNREKCFRLFEDKYMSNSSVGNTKQTLLQAIVNEYSHRETELVAKGDKYDSETLAARAQNLVKNAYDKTANWVSKDAYPYVVAKGGEFVGFMDREVVGPVGRFFERKYNHYGPEMKSYLQEKQAFIEEASIEGTFDRDLAFTVNTFNLIHNDGKATVMGIPGFYIDDAKTDKDKKVITVGHVDENGVNTHIAFDGEKGFKDNVQPNKDLATLATRRAQKLYEKGAEKYGDYLKNKSPSWNPKKKTWELGKVTLPQFADHGVQFPSDDARAEMYIDDKGEAAFKINGRDIKELKDEKEVAKRSFEGALERALAEDAGHRYEWVKGLKIEVTDVEPSGPAGAAYAVNGTLGGLKVKMIPEDGHNITRGIKFVDESGVTGYQEVLHIKADNGGKEFLNAKCDQILTSNEFITPFLQLEAVIDNTDESVLDRVKDVSLSGPIKNSKWKYLLDAKKMEALSMFQSMMYNKNGSDIQYAYLHSIKVITDQITNHIIPEIKNASASDRKAKFTEYVEDLETAGYLNPDYKALYKEFKSMINTFDMPGSESWENGIYGPTERYELYQQLNWIWSMNTLPYRDTDPDTGNTGNRDETLSDASKTNIRTNVIEAMRKKLEDIKAKGNGTLKLENMGAVESPKDAQEWIKLDKDAKLERSPWSVD